MENQRVRITKQMLKDALLRLLANKDLDKIPVSLLCQEAQINRTTFYRYYGSPYDVICEIREDFFRMLEEIIFGEKTQGQKQGHGKEANKEQSHKAHGSIDQSSNEQDSEGIGTLEDTLILLQKNSEVVNILLRVFSEDVIFEELFRRQSISGQVYRDTGSGFEENWKKEYVAAYSVHGTHTVIRKWLDGGSDIPPSEIAAFIRQINRF